MSASRWREQFRPQPGFAKVDVILAFQPRTVTVEQREPGDFQVGRRAAQADDVGEEQRVLRDAGREEQVGGRQLIRVAVRLRRFASFCLANCGAIAALTPTLTLCSSASARASSIFSLIVWRR